MLLVSSCSRIYPIRWSQVLSWEWRCSWSSADRRCSNYIWVIKNFIAYQGATYIRGFTVIVLPSLDPRLTFPSQHPAAQSRQKPEHGPTAIKMPSFQYITVMQHEHHGTANHWLFDWLFHRLSRLTSMTNQSSASLAVWVGNPLSRIPLTKDQ